MWIHALCFFDVHYGVAILIQACAAEYQRRAKHFSEKVEIEVKRFFEFPPDRVSKANNVINVISA